MKTISDIAAFRVLPLADVPDSDRQNALLEIVQCQPSYFVCRR